MSIPLALWILASIIAVTTSEIRVVLDYVVWKRALRLSTDRGHHIIAFGRIRDSMVLLLIALIMLIESVASISPPERYGPMYSFLIVLLVLIPTSLISISILGLIDSRTVTRMAVPKE